MLFIDLRCPTSSNFEKYFQFLFIRSLFIHSWVISFHICFILLICFLYEYIASTCPTCPDNILNSLTLAALHSLVNFIHYFHPFIRFICHTHKILNLPLLVIFHSWSKVSCDTMILFLSPLLLRLLFFLFLFIIIFFFPFIPFILSTA